MQSPRKNLESFQDALLKLLGGDVGGRTALVASMLRRDAQEATLYWLQLVVAAGIATFGLVLGSGAVIIGAMLIAPLMAPILALAMGLAAGSPFLVLRAAGRILLSVGVAVGGAAGITTLLPYHELTQELAQRTAPTALDLLTAGFCALAGVYASLRPGSDTATTAAGTSIGISLVPPLCASGYGLGVGSWQVATGAALLFLANLVAIIFVGTLMFAVAGFSRVAVAPLDREELARASRTQISTAIALRLAKLFEARFGRALRFLMPLILLAAVYVPLRRALDEVAWEVRTRAQVQSAIKSEPHRIIESRVRVDRRDVEVQVVLLGSAADAQKSRERLERQITRAGAANPHIEVYAVPDAQAFAGLESTLQTPTIASRVELGRHELQHEFDSIRGDVERLFPSESSGAPLGVYVEMRAPGSLSVRVVRVGEPLPAAAREALQRSLQASLGREVTVIDAALPSDELNLSRGELQFVSDVASVATSLRGVSEVALCVTSPDQSKESEVDRAVSAALTPILAENSRVTRKAGDAWRVHIARGGCPSAESPSAATPSAGGSRGSANADTPGAGGAEGS
jgi:uncharacterized hydrophobic protein (TIGR00271 family)